MGWFRNLIDRLTRKRLPEASEKNTISIPNTFGKYKVDSNGKNKELKEAIESARRGENIIDLKLKYLSETEKKICSSIGLDLRHGHLNQEDVEQIGGMHVLVENMEKEALKTAKEWGYLPNEAYRFVGNTIDTVQAIKKEKEQMKYREEFTIPYTAQRISTLDQLYNTAFEHVRMGNNIDENTLLKYASQRGGFPIQVGGNNPYVELVDLKCAINLAMSVANGFVKNEDINKIGGPADVIKEMSTDAKIKAKEANYTSDRAKNFVGNPSEIVQKMVTEKSDEREY